MSYAQAAKESGQNPTHSLVTEHLVLVKRIAHHLIARLPASIEIDDLIQAGMVALLEASAHYDESRGATFETYAGIRIRGAMLDEVRKSDWTPRSVHQKYRQLTDAIAAIESREGRAATDQEVADHLGLTMDQYHDVLKDSASCRLFSLNQPYADSDQVQEIAADDFVAPDDALDDEQFRGRLAEAIGQLPERERLVLSLYYQQDMNLKEVGKILEVSESRVCQIHGQALVRLRARLGDYAEHVLDKL